MSKASFLDMAAVVLGRVKSPLTPMEIVTRAKAAGLLVSSGKTPDRTLSAALYRDSLTSSPRFRRVYQRGRIRAVRGSVRWLLMRKWLAWDCYRGNHEVSPAWSRTDPIDCGLVRLFALLCVHDRRSL